jgi:phosphoadenosine phosphosulfate reductase
MSKTIPELQADSQSAEILRTGIEAASGPVSLACSFSMEDVAIIDIAHQAGLKLGVFALDTGRLNEETYEVSEALAERYRIKIDWYFPKHEDVEKLEQGKGLFSFRESLDNRNECCRIRKVEPLSRALKELKGWVTGMRRDQSVTRSDLKAIEPDSHNNGIIKINPLLDWSEEQLLAYVDQNHLPKNRLYEQGYRSIGCAPCTRAIGAWDHVREGRWWWESAEHKECGLHRR